MEQLEMLWLYQQADMEVERFERKMRQNPNRQQLIKHRDFILEQQNVVKKVEADVAMMSDRVEALSDEIKRLQNSVQALGEQLQNNPPQDIEETRRQLEGAQKLVDTISRYESEIQKIRKDSEARDKQQHDARLRAAKARQEYERIKPAYDKEYKEQSVELEKLRARAQEAAQGIEEAYMEKYKTIKKHSLPPMTRLNSDRCGGCNMSLPAAVLSQIRTGAAAVECENCGRIILIEQ